MKPLVLLDTNILLLAVRKRFQVEEGIVSVLGGADIRVPSSVTRELKRLANRGVPNASAALRFSQKFAAVDTDLEGDAAMETLGRELNAWIVTLDGELRGRLEKYGIGVLFPRGRAGLAPSRAPV